MRRESVVFSFILLTASSGCLNAQTRPQDTTLTAAAIRESRSAAAAGLESLRTLAATNYRALGFTSPTEAAGTSLGDPLVVYDVPLDSLRVFGPTTDPTKLLRESGRVIYPVMLGSATRSSIQLSREGTSWHPVAFGGPSATAQLVSHRAALTSNNAMPSAAVFVVRVLALNVQFLGSRSGADLTLVPVVDDPRGRWKAGARMSAKDVFTLLAPDARAANGLPG